MYKTLRGIKRYNADKRTFEVDFIPKWISEKTNIKEQFAILVKQCKDFEDNPARPEPNRPTKQSCLVPPAVPDDRPSTSGCDESVVELNLEHNPGLGTLQASELKSRPRKPLCTRKRKRRPKRRPTSAKSLKYLGLYEDIRFLSELEPSPTGYHPKPTVLSKVSMDIDIGPANTKILPEEIMTLFPKESSDLQTVMFGRTPQVRKITKFKPTMFECMAHKKKVKLNPAKPPNLLPSDTLVVVVRVYWPNYEKPKWIHRRVPPKLCQVIVMLGSQTLDHLKDMIHCSADSIVPDESSQDPLNVSSDAAKDVYKSGFFFINDAFYNDMRDPANIDYSEVIRKWSSEKGIGQFESYKMENTRMQDLTLRLGFPYCYQHQGSCEHIVVISDIRLLNGSDSQFMLDYPFVAYKRCHRVKMCYLCARFPSQWLVLNSIRVPYNPSHFCDKCFLSFNYLDGKVIGQFEAYNYTGPFYVA